MTYPLTVPERLLTWLDVERVLKQKTQEKEKDMKDRHTPERLQELKSLLDKKFISQEEYDRKREAILEEL